MIRLLAPFALLALLPGCVVATVAGAAVGTAVKVTGAAVGTAVDAATTTQKEADEDRGKAMRKEEERQRKEAENARKAAEKEQKAAEKRAREAPSTPESADIPQPVPESATDNPATPR